MPKTISESLYFVVKYIVCCVYINDEEKSGVVLGYFLCISQLSSQKAKGLYHLF